MSFKTLFVTAMVLIGCYAAGKLVVPETHKAYYVYDCKIRQGKFALHPITKLAHPDNAVWRTPLIILLNGETLEKLLDLKINGKHPVIPQKLTDHLIHLSSSGYNVFIFGYYHVDHTEVNLSLNNFVGNMRGPANIQGRVKILDADENGFAKNFQRDDGTDYPKVSVSDLPGNEFTDGESIVSYLRKL